MKLSPIVFFAYNRPALTLKTLSALKNSKLHNKSKIIFYIDISLVCGKRFFHAEL